MLPQFESFARRHRWGDSKTVRKGLATAFAVAAGEPCDPATISALVGACEESIPDTEDFDETASAALNAVTAVAETLECCVDRRAQHALEVSELALDSIEGALDRAGVLSEQDMRSRRRAPVHPEIAAELRVQLETILVLRSVRVLTRATLRLLRSRFGKPQRTLKAKPRRAQRGRRS